MGWIDLLRLLVLVGLVSGAWRTWKALPEPTRHAGRRYYRQPDGGYSTAWGLRVKDKAVVAALEAVDAARPPKP